MWVLAFVFCLFVLFFSFIGYGSYYIQLKEKMSCEKDRSAVTGFYKPTGLSLDIFKVE